MTDQRTIAATEDPVCGMTVDPAQAREKGLTLTLEGTEYAFGGKGCLLDFRDEPRKYLDPAYTPLNVGRGVDADDLASLDGGRDRVYVVVAPRRRFASGPPDSSVRT